MPASRSEEVLAALDPEVAEHTAAETHGSAVELATDPHETVADAVSQLSDLRAGLGTRAGRARAGRRRGRHASAGAAGRTRRSPPERATSSCTPRCASWRGASRRSRCTCTSRCLTPASAIRALNGVRAQLPVLLAASANSPFWQGRDSGLASARTPVFQAFPRTGPPRHFATYEEYVEAIDVLLRCDAFPEPTFLWWDVRLQPTLGTIEVRVMDAQTRVTDTAALAALVQCLVRREALEGDEAAAPMAPEVLEENRFLAARDGMRAKLRRPGTQLLRAGRSIVLTVLVRSCAPHAQWLRCVRELVRRGRARAPARRGPPAGAGRAAGGAARGAARTQPRLRDDALGAGRPPAGLTRAMCGFAAELRAGGAPDRDALERMGDGAGPARARRRRAVAGRRRRPRAPATGDHRPLRAGRAADARRRRSACGVVFNGCIYNHRELRRELEAQRPRVRLQQRHRGAAEGLGRVGRGDARPARGHVRVLPGRGAHRAAGAGPRPPRGQAAVPRPSCPAAACAPPPRCPRCCAPAASTRAWTPWRCTTTCRGTRSCPRRARSCAASAKLAARHRAGGRARRQPARAPLLGPAVRPRPRARRLERGRLDGRRPRGAARRRHPAHGGRRPGRGAAVGRAGLEPDRRAAGARRASAGWPRSRSASPTRAGARATSSATRT